MIVKNSNFHVTSTPSCYRFVSSRNEKKSRGVTLRWTFSKAVTENFSKTGAFHHAKKKTQRETRFTLIRLQTKILKNATQQKLKTHTHENRTRNNTDVKVSERACRSRACGSVRHTSSVLSSLFPNLIPITHLLWFLKAIAFLALCTKK